MKRYIKSAITKDSEYDLEELDYEDILYLAENSTDAEFLRILYDSTDSEYTKMLISQNPNTPEDVALKLLADPDLDNHWVRMYLAMSTTIPHVLEILADSSEQKIRQYVLWNKYTPIDTIRKLINDGTKYDANSLIFRKNLPDDVLIQLYQSDLLDDKYHDVFSDMLWARGIKL